jgi:hypothetical protein
MNSNQNYMDPSLTRVSNITIAAGSSGVVLSDLFQLGCFSCLKQELLTNCTLKSLKWAHW